MTVIDVAGRKHLSRQKIGERNTTGCVPSESLVTVDSHGQSLAVESTTITNLHPQRCSRVYLRTGETSKHFIGKGQLQLSEIRFTTDVANLRFSPVTLGHWMDRQCPPSRRLRSDVLELSLDIDVRRARGDIEPRQHGTAPPSPPH